MFVSIPKRFILRMLLRIARALCFVSTTQVIPADVYAYSRDLLPNNALPYGSEHINFCRKHGVSNRTSILIYGAFSPKMPFPRLICTLLSAEADTIPTSLSQIPPNMDDRSGIYWRWD